YDPWALAEFFSKDQLERGPERIVRRHLSLHWGAGAEPRIRPAAAAAAVLAQRADQPVGLGNRGKAGKQRQRGKPTGAGSACIPCRACGCQCCTAQRSSSVWLPRNSAGGCCRNHCSAVNSVPAISSVLSARARFCLLSFWPLPSSATGIWA